MESIIQLFLQRFDLENYTMIRNDDSIGLRFSKNHLTIRFYQDESKVTTAFIINGQIYGSVYTIKNELDSIDKFLTEIENELSNLFI